MPKLCALVPASFEPLLAELIDIQPNLDSLEALIQWIGTGKGASSVRLDVEELLLRACNAYAGEMISGEDLMVRASAAKAVALSSGLERCVHFARVPPHFQRLSPFSQH